MKLYYSQAAGTWTTEDGAIVARGWAGNDDNPLVNPTGIKGKNRPEAQAIHSIGPLPRGLYSFGAWESFHDRLGPMVVALIPDHANTMFGRSGFFCHGASRDPELYGQESKGCTVVEHTGRMAIKLLNPTHVEVVE